MAGIFEEIYLNYKAPVFGYLYRCTSNRHIAEELTQETFLRAFKYFSSFRGTSSAKTWILKIARNVYFDYSKKRPREVDISDYEIADKSDAILSFDEKSIINRVFTGLREDEKAIIVYRDMNGLTYKEIAEIMEYSEGQVKIGLFRARKKFRELYKAENREEF